jgi:hypothetical protein
LCCTGFSSLQSVLRSQTTVNCHPSGGATL